MCQAWRAVIAPLSDLWVTLGAFRKMLAFSPLLQTLGGDTLPQRIPISLTIQLMTAINITQRFVRSRKTLEQT